MKTKIKKIKIKAHCLEVEMSETVFLEDGASYNNEVAKKCNALIHPDLQAAFDRLKPHFAHICDLKESDAISGVEGVDMSALSDLNVCGLSISGTDKHEGCVLIGSKSIGKKALNLVTPFTKYSDANDYAYGVELSQAVEACVYEAEQYLFNGKCAVKQLEIPFDEHGEPMGAPEEASESEKPKRKKRAKKEVELEHIDVAA